MKIKVKRIDTKAHLPEKHNVNDAGFDLYSVNNVYFSPGETKIVRIGICMEIPQGYYGQIETRSSMASKGIFTTGGIVDSGYRDEIMVIVNNSSVNDYQIKSGDRIAQILFHRVEPIELLEADELDETTDRGGGLGSSGK